MTDNSLSCDMIIIDDVTEPIKWHEPEDSKKFLTFEDVEKMMKSYNPVEFRRQYLNEPDSSEPPCISSEVFDKAKETWMARTNEYRRSKMRKIFNVLETEFRRESHDN